MIPLRLTDATRSMKEPANWDEKQHGKCMTLDIHDGEIDGHPVMVSAWELEPGELTRLAAGAPIYLRIWGVNHPVVSVFAGEPEHRAS